MRVDFHRNFDKRLAKLNLKQKEQFKLRLVVFVQDQYKSELNNHALKGKFQGYRSINVTGDIRAVSIPHNENHSEFVDIGSHSQLYG
jgi:mRNA-degrading endonuclease YafQ of YafQ-DinJ toxin-antitoxin module